MTIAGYPVQICTYYCTYKRALRYVYFSHEWQASKFLVNVQRQSRTSKQKVYYIIVV